MSRGVQKVDLIDQIFFHGRIIPKSLASQASSAGEGRDFLKASAFVIILIES